jgi:hypothetical protein
MARAVTICTKGDQIFLDVITELTARLNMVNLKTFHPSARLATPAVSLEHLPAKLTICFGGKPQSRPFGLYSGQGAT